MYARGYALGTEFRGKGVNVDLAPVAGPFGRAPAAGRNWEGFGTDPYLSGNLSPASHRELVLGGVRLLSGRTFGIANLKVLVLRKV